MFACDVCGFPYRYPSEMVRGDDRLFYCRRTCWLGKTALTDRQEAAAAHRRREEMQPPAIGKKPDYWE